MMKQTNLAGTPTDATWASDGRRVFVLEPPAKPLAVPAGQAKRSEGMDSFDTYMNRHTGKEADMVYEYVLANDSATPESISEGTGIGLSSTMTALSQLIRERKIEEIRRR
jgi:hypothetical protein